MTYSSQRVLTNSRSFKMPFGANILPDGAVEFNLWAPNAKRVELCLIEGGEPIKVLPMEASKDGWFRLKSTDARDGTLYKFRIDGDLMVPDPASRYQPEDVHGPSQVVDPSKFGWNDLEWRGRPYEEVVCYELHVGTFSPEGTFRGVTERLDYLKDLGVTAIELLPLADFPGKWNWGYDGVLLFAPDSTYGTPDDLRHLIQTAHQKGLMVFADVVYNHFGPEGNYLHAYAKSFFTEKHNTPWGAAINFDDEGSAVVRQFYVCNALYWLTEFNFDGIRFDAVHAIRDNSPVNIMTEIADAVAKGPGAEREIHLILENDENTADFLERSKDGKPVQYHAQWLDDIHHAFHVLATKEKSGYYADYNEGTSARSPLQHLVRCLSEGFAYQDEPSQLRDGEHRGQPSKHLPPTAFISFMQNHDQVGNRAFGDRIASLSDEKKLRALYVIFLLAPSIPMLFMGEEWASRTPFCFFCDLGADLAKKVTEGRRNEFSRFPEFQDPSKREKIPDPVNPETFRSSKLDWADLDRMPHRNWWQFTRQLLSLRREHIVPMLRNLPANCSEVLKNEPSLIAIRWQLQRQRPLILIANLSDKEFKGKLDFIDGLDLLFESDNGVFDGIRSGTLSPWSAAWLK